MELTERLRQWGSAHSAARAAERTAGRHASSDSEAHREAKALREQADRMHREIYMEIERPRQQRA